MDSLAGSAPGSLPFLPASPLDFLPRHCAARFLLPLLLAGAGLPALRAQDLVGCQLQDGSLQCVPGVTADPQQQIRLLRQDIADDQKIEGAVEQRIAGLDRLVLQGEARQGSLLRASAAGGLPISLPATAFHWYRLAPGRRNWQLIQGAGGATYGLTPADVAYQVMVVVAVPTAGGSQRSVSQVVGPIKAGPMP